MFIFFVFRCHHWLIDFDGFFSSWCYIRRFWFFSIWMARATYSDINIDDDDDDEEKPATLILFCVVIQFGLIDFSCHAGHVVAHTQWPLSWLWSMIFLVCFSPRFFSFSFFFFYFYIHSLQFSSHLIWSISVVIIPHLFCAMYKQCFLVLHVHKRHSTRRNEWNFSVTFIAYFCMSFSHSMNHFYCFVDGIIFIVFGHEIISGKKSTKRIIQDRRKELHFNTLLISQTFCPDNRERTDLSRFNMQKTDRINHKMNVWLRTIL